MFAVYSSPNTKARKKAVTAEDSWWSGDICIAILTLVLSACDTVTLYTAFDSVLAQSPALSVFLSGVFAVMLNFIPLLAARTIHCKRYGLEGTKTWHIAGIFAVFFVLFLATFIFRFATRELMFGSLTGGMTSTIGSVESVDAVSSRGELAISILLGVSPFITSAINFFLGLIAEDPIKRKVIALSVESARVEDAISRQRAIIDELENNDWGQIMIDYDRQSFEAVCSAVQYDTAYIKSLARLHLAKAMKSTEDIIAVTNSQP